MAIICVLVYVCGKRIGHTQCDVTASGSHSRSLPLGWKNTQQSTSAINSFTRKNVGNAAKMVKSRCATDCTNTFRNNSSKSFMDCRWLKRKEGATQRQSFFSPSPQSSLQQLAQSCLKVRIQHFIIHSNVFGGTGTTYHIQKQWRYNDHTSLLPKL